MKFRRLNETAFVDFCENVSTVLAGSELAGIKTSVRTTLAAAIGTLPAKLGEQALDLITLEGQRKAAVSEREATRQQLNSLMSQVQKALAAGFAPKEQYDLCNFDFPATPVGAYIPHDPTDLAVTGSSNRTNSGRFKGNNRTNSVHFEIWRRSGASGEWIFISTVSKQKFIDSPVTPGQYYEYKVRAVARQAVSNFSNTAIVYGT
jgi:hypothetical protein